MRVLAAITADDINTWKELALVAIAAVGVVGAAAIGMIATLIALVQSRLNALHNTQQNQQQQISTLQLATVPATATPPAAAAPQIKLQVSHEALAKSLALELRKSPLWPPPNPSLPTKA